MRNNQASAADPRPNDFHYISADVAEQDGATGVIRKAMTWNNGQSPDIVWCIAGAAHPGFFIETPTAGR